MPHVVHFEILGTDSARSREFYSSLFDWQIDADNPIEYGIVEGSEHGIGGGIAAALPGGKPMVTVYVQVDAIQPYLDKAVSMGGKVVIERTVLPGMVTFAQFEDPDGNVIGLAEAETPPEL
jgi:uncharacterized protein